MKYKPLLVLVILLFVALPRTWAEESKAVRLSALNSMLRIGQDQKPFGPAEVKVEAAKNEWESFQVVVSAGEENLRITQMELSELVGKDGAKIGAEHIHLYREEYVRVRRSTPHAELPPGLYADPLVPVVNPYTGKTIEPKSRSRERWGGPIVAKGHDMFAIPFDLFRGQNQPIWVDIHVPKNIPAGEYKGIFRIRTRRRITAEIGVCLTVWNFALPEGPTHGNHFGNFRNITKLFDVKPSSEKFKEIEMRYCQAMAEHRLTPPIPSNLLPQVGSDGTLKPTPEQTKALGKFLADFHMNHFEIPRRSFVRFRTAANTPDYKTVTPEAREKTIRYYKQYYDYLKQNGWEHRAFVYLWDEPNLKENYEQVLVLAQLVHEAAPKIKCLVVEQTYPHEADWPDLDPAIDIWCPLWAFIDRKTIQEKIAHGDEVWSYTALVQRAPSYHPEYEKVKGLNPPYWHIDRPLLVYRVPTWINRQYGITGLLYWTTMTTVIEPWFNPAFSTSSHYNGGGYLFYPGVPCGIEGPVASMRLKNLRDGMDDYEYLALLAKLCGDEAAQKAVDQIAPNWWDYCRDPQKLLSVRRQMAKAIQAATR